MESSEERPLSPTDRCEVGEKRSGEFDDPIPRKKRRRCGGCEPCLRKVNCGECSNCVNRKTGHQICKFRKCIELKKKTTAGIATKRDSVQLRQAINESDVSEILRRVSSEETDKRSGDGDTQNEIITASDSCYSKPQKVGSSKEIHEQITVSAPQLQEKEEINAIEDAPGLKDVCVNETARDSVQLSSTTKPSVEKLLSTSKPSASRGESDLEPPPCYCPVSGKEDGPYYTYLGTAANLNALRCVLEERFGIKGEALRIELIGYTGKEGKNHLGCPIARWVLRRSGDEEKILVIARKRADHVCDEALIVVNIVLWEGISQERADFLYSHLSTVLPQHGVPTVRRCGINETKSCGCQGLSDHSCGASFSFGCSWSMYYNGCKFTRSKSPRKFKLLDPSKEEEFEKIMQSLANDVSDTYERIAPRAFKNQVKQEKEGMECRIGSNEKRPFSGVTCCLDFCAHSHKDSRNMDGGATLVCTLLKPGDGSTDDEQLHVLPLYRLLDKDGAPVNPNYDIPSHFFEPSVGVSPGYSSVSGHDSSPKNQTNKTVHNQEQYFKEERKESVPDANNNSNHVFAAPFDEKHIPHGFAQSLHGFPTSVIHHHPASNHAMSNCYNGHYPPRGPPLFPFHPHVGSNYVLNHCRAPEVHWVDENRIPYLYRNPGHLNHFHNSSRNYVDGRKLPFITDPWECRMPYGKSFGVGGSSTNRGKEYAKPNTVIHHFNGAATDVGKTPSQIKWVDDKEVPLMRASGVLHGDGKANTKEDAENRKNGKDSVHFEHQRKPFRIEEDMGGVAIALGHGSLLIEVAKKELHATTPLKNPRRQNPTRISLVFYQHKQMNLTLHGLGEWEQKVAKKKMEEEAASLETDAVEEESVVSESKADERRDMGYLDMLAETALSRADIEPPNVSKNHVSNVATSDSLIPLMNGDVVGQKNVREQFVSHPTSLSDHNSSTRKEENVSARYEFSGRHTKNNVFKFPPVNKENENKGSDLKVEKLSKLPVSNSHQDNHIHVPFEMRNGERLPEHSWFQALDASRQRDLPLSANEQTLESSLHKKPNSDALNVITSPSTSSNDRAKISFGHVPSELKGGATRVETLTAGDSVKTHSLPNGIIPERIVNSNPRIFGSGKNPLFVEPPMAKSRDERTNGKSGFSVSRILGDENDKDTKLNSASSSYRISNILREEKSSSEISSENNNTDKPQQLTATRPVDHADHSMPMRNLSAPQHPLQLPASSRFPFLPHYPQSSEERDKLGSGPERQYLDLSMAANRLLGGYSPYKFGVPFPTFPSFYMPPFHPLLAGGNGLSSNLALVNSQNYMSSFVDSAKRIRDLNGIDQASLTTISTATRTGVSFPIDTLITVAPYTQTCVTGHYQNWL